MDRIYTIGRDRKSDIPISQEYDMVSNNHAILCVTNNDACYIEDIGSRNGTFVNGKRINPNRKYWLNRGDSINLSGKVTFYWEQFLPDRTTKKKDN